jgi:hypothetical protein
VLTLPLLRRMGLDVQDVELRTRTTWGSFVGIVRPWRVVRHYERREPAHNSAPTLDLFRRQGRSYPDRHDRRAGFPWPTTKDASMSNESTVSFPPQTAAGKVLWHFTMSLDGLVAGPGRPRTSYRHVDE